MSMRRLSLVPGQGCDPGSGICKADVAEDGIGPYVYFVEADEKIQSMSRQIAWMDEGYQSDEVVLALRAERDRLKAIIDALPPATAVNSDTSADRRDADRYLQCLRQILEDGCEPGESSEDLCERTVRRIEAAIARDAQNERKGE